MSVLKRDFYLRKTNVVAKELLGKLLVRQIGGERLAGIIVETEAYQGFDDTASHAHKGPTDRCRVMFGKAGFAYVYLTYGIHHMFNIVTEKEGYPSAILIRACQPVEGIENMLEERGVEGIEQIASGPGKLTKALRIDKGLNGADIAERKEIWVEDPLETNSYRLESFKVSATPRIGIGYADEESRKKKWRFLIKDNPHVSV